MNLGGRPILLCRSLPYSMKYFVIFVFLLLRVQRVHSMRRMFICPVAESASDPVDDVDAAADTELRIPCCYSHRTIFVLLIMFRSVRLVAPVYGIVCIDTAAAVQSV